MRWELMLVAAVSLSCALRAEAQTPRLRITFTPESTRFAPAADEYRRFWEAEGDRITDALEAVSGLHFEENDIQAIVFEGASSSGFRDIPMRLRASYSPDDRKAAMMHELGHRLEGRFFRKGEDDHPVLFLYLYDAWVRLYGQSFADKEIRVESARKGLYDYASAWRTALSMTPAQRAAKWREFLKTQGVQMRGSP